MTTMDSRFRNSDPSGRSHSMKGTRPSDGASRASRPSPSPATSPSAIAKWLPIGRTVLFPGTMITGTITLRNA
jgi:hypothetical protein